MIEAASTHNLSKHLLAGLGATLRRGWRSWFATRPPRDLRLCESLALGEKRFVAVVGVGPRRYLVGGTATSLTLLSELPVTPAVPTSLAETR